MAESFFPTWQVRTEGVIAPDERLPWPQTLAMGVQHVVAMFGATVLAPLLMGFDPNVAILMSGFGTLLFFVLVGGRVPSYLGSSFAFIGVVIAASGYAGQGANANIGVALGGIIAAGALYALIGIVVMAAGTQWIERLMPPVVTGAVVAVIGLNLAPIAVKGATATNFDAWMALVTILCVGSVAVFTRGMLQRLLILVGLLVAYLIYLLLANGMGLGKPIAFGAVASAAWLGLPRFAAPVFRADAMGLIAPVAIILVAENLGHIKAVSAMTHRDLDRYMGRAFVGDGVATMLAGAVGGTGVTTYAENIGVMAVTKIYSTIVFVVAALIAILLGLLAEVRRADPDDSGAGAGRGLDRRVRADRGRRRADLGREQGRLRRQPQPDRRRRHAGPRRRRLHAQARQLHAGRHRHRHLRRADPLRTAARQVGARRAHTSASAPPGQPAPPWCRPTSVARRRALRAFASRAGLTRRPAAGTSSASAATASRRGLGARRPRARARSPP